MPSAMMQHQIILSMNFKICEILHSSQETLFWLVN